MEKIDYVARQLARATTKRFEHYVVTRIWHKLDNSALKFTTQQLVTRPSGRAFSDMFFPQLGIHIEVDEGHHFQPGGSRVEADLHRERDVVNATGHQVVRIRVAGETLESVNAQVDSVVDQINQRLGERIARGEFTPWDIEAEFNPQTYIRRGSMSVSEGAAFRRIVDACNCFGHDYVEYQQAVAPHGVDPNVRLWFPKLYVTRDWQNSISVDEREIQEELRTKLRVKGRTISGQREYVEWILGEPKQHKPRITFAHAKDSLGQRLYRFKGVFELDKKKTVPEGSCVFYRRIADSVQTVPSAAHRNAALV